MKCPTCEASTEVIDSRWTGPRKKAIGSGADQSVRRRRVCLNGHRHTSYETWVDEGFADTLEALERRIEALVVLSIESYAIAPVAKYRALADLLGMTNNNLALAAGFSNTYLSHVDSQMSPEACHKFDQVIGDHAEQILKIVQVSETPQQKQPVASASPDPKEKPSINTRT